MSSSSSSTRLLPSAAVYWPYEYTPKLRAAWKAEDAVHRQKRLP